MKKLDLAKCLQRWLPSGDASRKVLETFAMAIGLNDILAEVAVATPPRPESFSPTAGWGSWLCGVGVPLGVFATDDFLARQFVAHCGIAERAVPGDVAVVGVGNSALDSVLAGIGITSVVLPFREIGRRAALRLRLVMSGVAECVTDRVLPERVMVRASSACAREQDPMVSRALGLIDTRLASPLAVSELAAAVGASRRSLEMRFRSALGRSPAEETRERRMALARQLLRSTRMPLADVAQQCGYSDVHHFSAQFKVMHGKPPGRWRSV